MVKYLIAFSLYTLAMTGIFFLAYIVYKKTMSQGSLKKENGMKIEDALRLSQRKTLYIVNVCNERFLIASDIERTTFLAKLENKTENKTETKISFEKEFKPVIENEQKNIVSSLFTREELKPKAKPNNETKKQIENYIKELEEMDFKEDEIAEKEEDDYSNAIDIRSKQTILKSILKELKDARNMRV